ncbi:MAG: hypothetical protein M2R45_00765 [Verrucomicrobia subdivision 3 bacterium]|nr:hypothetical protein [Limisphaerales bacterium]MCS1413129.1 hypothetical protein [Limisphaerales bacterium]
MMLKNWAFTATSALILAVGIGGVTVISAALLRSIHKEIPYADTDQLVIPRATNRQTGTSLTRVSVPEFEDWKSPCQSFESMSLLRMADRIRSNRSERPV